MVIEFDFSWLDLQGRSVKGSTLTAHKVDRVVNAPKTDEVDPSSPDVDKPTKERKSPKEPEPEKKSAAKPEKNSNPSDEKEQVTFDFKDN